MSWQITAHGQTGQPVYPVVVSDVSCAHELFASERLEFIREAPANNMNTPVIMLRVQDQDACTLTLHIPATDAAQRLAALSPVLAAALPDYTHTINLSPLSRVIIEGLAAYGAGDCATAQELWGSVRTPLNAFYRANCLLLHDEPAAAAYQVAGILLPEQRHYLPAVHAAWLNIDAGNEADAGKIITQQLAPDNTLTERQRVDLLARRAQLHALLYDYSAAIADVESALQITPDSSALHTLLGQMHLLTYEWDAAETAFDRAIALEPTNAEAYFRRGTLLYTMARREDAARDFHTYLEMSPEGDFAELARDYIDSIETELEALEPPS